MKISLPILLGYLYCFSLSYKSQNLVPNSSFELAHRFPEGKDNSINRAKGWIAPKYNSDYYHKKASGRHAGVPGNIFGRQKPHSGDAYAGICTRTKFLEYVEAKLLDTLIKDKEYLVEFYISRAERSLGAVKEFGALFTGKTRWGITDRGISDKPQVDFIKARGFRNKKKWTKLSAVYTAEGTETAIIIGHFNYDPSDDRRRILCHYYIDDVSVTPVEAKTGNAEVPPEITNSRQPVPDLFFQKLNETITLQNIFFQVNKSELLPGSFPELDKLVVSLEEMDDTSIIISGHTDNTGNEEKNKKLSELRAKAVADYLRSKGIEDFRITYYGYGSVNPIATNSTDEGKKQNRRVEFIITKN